MNEKRFTIVVMGPVTEGLTEHMVRNAIQKMCIDAMPSSNTSLVVWEHNKTHTCDGCGKQRRDVKSCGRDSNGDPDAPDLCFLCRKQGERRKVWSFKDNRYVAQASIYSDDDEPASGPVYAPDGSRVY